MSSSSAFVRTWIGILCLLAAGAATASDHGDTLLLVSVGRHDARITDLFAFVRGDRIVFAVCLDPTVSPSAADYRFASDLVVRVHVDNRAAVAFDDPWDLATYGGTLVEPERIRDDVVFRIGFDDRGRPRLHTTGGPTAHRSDVRLFAGLRDDPFIRGPREGRNVAAVVLELPLADVLADQDTLLVWATTKVETVDGAFQDLAGRALRSQFPENDLLNTTRPRQHAQTLDVVPDVVIYDTSRPAAFPNGRELADDVVDLTGDSRMLATDAPFPAANDLPFLDGFPYLAPPHPPE